MKAFSKSDYILFFLVLAALVWIFFALPPLSLYSHDEGAKYVQMKNFYLNGSLAIQYPGENINLPFRHFLPQSLDFAQSGDKLYCIFPPLFAYLSSLFYPFLGDRVTHFLPMLTFFLSLLLLSRILKWIIRETFLYYLLLATFLIGSPLFLYAFTFWEHLPSVFIVVGSLYFLVRHFYVKESRRDIFLSAFVLGLGIFFRTEIFYLMVAFLISFGTLVGAQRKAKNLAPLLIGAALPVLGYVLFNLRNYENILGLYIWHNYKELKIYHFSIIDSIVSLGVTVLCLGLVLGARRGNLDAGDRREMYSFAAILGLGFLLAFFGKSPGVKLFSEFPAAFLVFFGISSRIEKFKDESMVFGNLVFGIIVLFIFLVQYFLHGNPHKSVRFCLPIIPFIIIFLASEHKRIFVNRWMHGITALLILFSFSFGLYNLKNDIWKHKSYNSKRIEFLKKYTHDGDVIVFAKDGLMEYAGPLFFERIYCITPLPETLTMLFNVLKERGVGYCYFWASGPGCSSGSFSDQNFRVISSERFGNSTYLFKVLIE